MISSVNELNKLLRKHLIKQSEIDANNVLNGLSIYGAELEKRIEEQIFASYDVNNVVIVFELKTLDSSNNMSENDDEDIMLDSSYNMHVIIYGNNSNDVANATVARFRTPKVREEIHNDDIHLVKVTSPQSVNEYVNNTLWLRTDFDIEVSVEMKISQVSKEDDITSIDSINIIETK